MVMGLVRLSSFSCNISCMDRWALTCYWWTWKWYWNCHQRLFDNLWRQNQRTCFTSKKNWSRLEHQIEIHHNYYHWCPWLNYCRWIQKQKPSNWIWLLWLVEITQILLQTYGIIRVCRTMWTLICKIPLGKRWRMCKMLH